MVPRAATHRGSGYGLPGALAAAAFAIMVALTLLPALMGAFGFCCARPWSE